jgi:hypothetical protein
MSNMFLRAFDVHALHYLLKPADDTRFAAAVSRARDLIDSSLKADMAERVMKMLDVASDGFATRFMVQTGSGIQIVIAEDVEWIGAAGDYVELHVNGRSFLLRETMASLEQIGSTLRSFFAYTAPELCSQKGYSIHGEGLGRLGASLEPHLRRSTLTLVVISPNLIMLQGKISHEDERDLSA